MSPETTPTPEQQVEWDATREQNPQRAEWMAHAEKIDVETAFKMNKMAFVLRHFQEPGSKPKMIAQTANKRRAAGRKKANTAGRRFDQEIRDKEE